MLPRLLILLALFYGCVLAYLPPRHSLHCHQPLLLRPIYTYRGVGGGCDAVVLYMNSGEGKDELDSLKLDMNKLSRSEQDRLKMIQQLTSEADELATKAGFDLSSDDDMLEKSVSDTNWSGQSTMDSVIASENNYNDLTSRLGLAFGDFLALFIFAAIGRNNHEEGVDSTQAPARQSSPT